MFFGHAREPINSLTHFIGAVLSVVGTFFLVFGAMGSNPLSTIMPSAIIFGISLTLLYSASSLYHYVKASALALTRLRKLDHAMIYVLIAGTYTPLLLRFSERGVSITLLIWAVAALGIVLKVCWLNAPRALSTFMYMLLGWAIVLDLTAVSSMPGGAITLLLLGGLSYTVGAVIYVIKRPNFSKDFGFHELFHLFVMLGSILHFFTVYLYVL